MMIQAEALTKIYQMGDNEVRALNGASFKIEKGEMVAIMGPSAQEKHVNGHHWLFGCTFERKLRIRWHRGRKYG